MTARKQKTTAPPTTEKGPHVVGLGASAGGLEALETFFEHMPPDTGVSFVVVQHLSPDYKSLMVELLSRRTAMRVLRVEDGMALEPDCVYLIPPRKNMIVFRGQLLLTEQERGHTINLPIDIFFRSLAEDQGQRAIGIILSGTGSDGMRGVRAIKEAGGMVMAQDEASAKFDGMPRSSVSTGLVDFVLPPEAMPEQLLKYIRHPYAQSSGAEPPALVTDDDSLARILSLVQRSSGVDFTFYKPSTIARRIERRMSVSQILALPDYVRYLEGSPREVGTLYKDLLIGVTSFFRDPDAFEVLRARVLPELFEPLGDGAPLRVWVAGCSTGEEAYSLAILLREQADACGKRVDAKVFATDIDREALDFAGMGAYPESIAADVSRERLARFFVRRGDSYQVVRPLREMVIFAKHNLLRDPPFTKIDLVSCRNLLIYLQAPVQKKILSFFDFSLRAGGALFLGSSETVGDMTSQFEPVDNRWKVYRSRGGVRKSLPDALSLAPGRESARPGAFRPRPGFRVPDDERGKSALYQSLLEEYLPPSVVVDEHYDILHVLSDVGDFVRLPVGKLTFNVLKAVPRDLSSALSTALHKAGKGSQEVLYRNVQFEGPDGRRRVNLRVKPFEDRRGQRLYFTVFFENPESRAPEGEASEILDGRDNSAERITDLERDLQYTKENLQATIEELETSNEELQATNEELVSANEELQSTNEELQSVNEELYTVNAEYQNKIHELVVLNNDIDNLLHSTSFGTIFLDERLNVRKFTAPATRVLDLQQTDVGRPFAQVSHRLRYERLLDDVQAAFANHETLEREVQTEGGAWLLMSVGPYLKEGVPTRSGVVITFVEITAHREALEALRRSEEEHRRLFESMAQGVVYQDREGRIVAANPAAQAILGLSLDELQARTSLSPEWRAVRPDGSELPGHEHPAMVALRTGLPQSNFVMGVVRPASDERRWLSVSAVPQFRPGEGAPWRVLTTFEDVTELRRAGDAAQRSDERYRLLFNEMLAAAALHDVIVDDDGRPVDYRFVDVNPAFERLLGVPRERLVGKTAREVFPRIEPHWIETYGRVALTGESVRFRDHFAERGKTYEVTAFRPAEGQFAVTFVEAPGRRASPRRRRAVPEEGPRT